MSDLTIPYLSTIDRSFRGLAQPAHPPPPGTWTDRAGNTHDRWLRAASLLQNMRREIRACLRVIGKSGRVQDR